MMMRKNSYINYLLLKRRYAFTLIELLIVIAVIALLLALLVPALQRAKAIAQKVKCKSNLREIAQAWNVYLDENDEYFYQGVNVNHTFGGWRGIGGFSPYRPLNKQMNLPTKNASEENAQVFLCPSDSENPKAFKKFGNSYQTNIFLVGPDQVGIPLDKRKELHEEINKNLKRLKRSGVSQPGRLLLVGDNPWILHWNPKLSKKESWHSDPYFYNVAFLDSHVKYLRIRKGLYLNPKEDYRILPFSELDNIAYDVQEEIP